MQHFASELKDSHRLPIGASSFPAMSISLLACGVCGSTVDFFPTFAAEPKLSVKMDGHSTDDLAPGLARQLSAAACAIDDIDIPLGTDACGADTDICNAVGMADDICIPLPVTCTPVAEEPTPPATTPPAVEEGLAAGIIAAAIGVPIGVLVLVAIGIGVYSSSKAAPSAITATAVSAEKAKVTALSPTAVELMEVPATPSAADISAA